MGMTIDEHIAQLKQLKSFHNGSYGASINFAIDTMRKYQKIEEIYKNEYKNYKIGDRGFSKEVRKVLEDGNDNQNN